MVSLCVHTPTKQCHAHHKLAMIDKSFIYLCYIYLYLLLYSRLQLLTDLGLSARAARLGERREGDRLQNTVRAWTLEMESVYIV